MAKIIAIDIGHNENLKGNIDSGAVGIKKEADLTMEVGQGVMEKLRAAGYTVINTLSDRSVRFDGNNYIGDSLASRCKKANDANADIFISIHFNASTGKGKGSEIWYMSDAGKALAAPILDKIVALGFTNRGLKKAGVDGKNLYVLKNTNMPACLLECAFVDNEADMKLYNTQKMINAIYEGITGRAAIDPPAPTPAAPAAVAPSATLDMKKLQEFLNNTGYKDQDNQTLVIDGILGSRTIFAARNLYKDLNKITQ